MSVEENWFQEILIVDSSAVIKTKLNQVLFSNSFCGLCLSEAVELTSIYTELEIFGDFGIHNLTLEGIINYVFKNEIAEKMARPQICSKCVRQVHDSYLFLCNTNYNMKVLTEYINTLDTRVSEVTTTENLEKLVITLHHQETDQETLAPEQEQINVESGYKCLKCNRILMPYEYFKTHESSHKWTNKKQCDYCQEHVFRKAYSKHLYSKHSNEVYACNICNRGFRWKNAYKKHNRTHEKVELIMPAQIESENDRMQCQFCLKDLDEITLKTHKCKYSCPSCDIYKCIHFDYLLSCLTQMMMKTKLSCPEESCDYTCVKRTEFIVHLNKEHLDYHPFTCDICKQQFYAKKILKNHIITYHQEDYICQYCDENFSDTKNLYHSHEEKCKAVVRDFKCMNCVASFNTNKDLERHHLKGCRNFPCPLCSWKFSDQGKLSEHKNKVHNGIQMVYSYGTPMECPVCNVKFNSYAQLRIHTKKHGDIKWQCKICNNTYPSRKKFIIHKASAHTKYQCHLCDKVYCKSGLRKHLYKHMHGKEPYKNIQMFSCDICGEVKKSKKSFEIHYSWHTKPVKCQECSKLVQEGRMKYHLAWHSRRKEHKTRRIHKKKCEQCDYEARSKAEIEAHVNQIHLKIRPYQCNICDKTFCGKFDLTRHMECHTRINQLTCELCSASLINKRSYQKHMAKHTGNRPFKCDLCSVSFITTTQLMQHKRNRHSDRVISCPITDCTGKFTSYRLLRSHALKYHWRRKDMQMDPSLMEGLPKKYYYLFEDQRRRKIEDDD